MNFKELEKRLFLEAEELPAYEPGPEEAKKMMGGWSGELPPEYAGHRITGRVSLPTTIGEIRNDIENIKQRLNQIEQYLRYSVEPTGPKGVEGKRQLDQNKITVDQYINLLAQDIKDLSLIHI